MDLEPRDDPDRIRVSDREREQIVELLGTAAAEGRLTLDEYAERAGAPVLEVHSKVIFGSVTVRPPKRRRG